MKKKPGLEDDEHDLEILKAVAQAWHGRSSNSRPTTEFDAHRLNFKTHPSRFKLQATSLKDTTARWDFGQSLWDSYEIVNVSRKLEAGLVLGHQFSGSGEPGRVHRRRKESKNSLRNLVNRVSSRRFNEADIPHPQVVEKDYYF